MKLVCVATALIIGQLIAVPVLADEEACDKNECPGPLRFYDDIGCKPIYKEEGDCCAVSYDCSHLQARKKDKCYIGLKEFEVGKLELPEHTDLCNSECMCINIESEGAEINCPVVDCPEFKRPEGGENCYYDFTKACCGELVCPKKGEEIKCEVGGKTYEEGEFFESPEDKVNLGTCQCLPGFKGEFAPPFCNVISCDDDLHNAANNVRGCAPIFFGAEALHHNCRVDTKCPDEHDYVESGTEPKTDERVCKFGEHTLHIGDKLKNNGTGVVNECLECTCEVPPTLSCVLHPEDECEKYKKECDLSE